MIQLGTCLDLTNVGYTAMLSKAYDRLKSEQRRSGRPLPKNKGKRRQLDCLVINTLDLWTEETQRTRIQTVRCPFLEGEPAFPGSGILRESHIQIAVRDKGCILGVFRPNLS